MEFNFDEYATLAETLAAEKAAAAAKLKTMNEQALQLQGELGKALFSPYVGKKIRVEYGRLTTLVRGSYYNHAPMLKRAEGGGHSGLFTGWILQVAWEPKTERMVVSVATEPGGPYVKPQYFLGDMGTQAVEAARYLARLVAEVLVIEEGGAA